MLRRRRRRSRDRWAAGRGVARGARGRGWRRTGGARIRAGPGGAQRRVRRAVMGGDGDACPRMGAALCAWPGPLWLRPGRGAGGGDEAAGGGRLGTRGSAAQRRLRAAGRCRAGGGFHRVAAAGAGGSRSGDALPADRSARRPGRTDVRLGGLDDLARRLAPVSGGRFRCRGARPSALARRTDPVAGECARRPLGA